MPEDLLLELETAPPVAVDLDDLEKQVPALEQIWRFYLNQVGAAVKGMRGSALLFENGWRGIVLDVARGQTAEIQALRPRLLSAFEKRLALLKRAYTLAVRLRQWHGEEAIPDPDVLLPEIEGMERLKAGVFDRWQSADDLEDLAARDYPLTTADLDQIGPHCRPPASYYAEESKPF